MIGMLFAVVLALVGVGFGLLAVTIRLRQIGARLDRLIERRRDE